MPYLFHIYLSIYQSINLSIYTEVNLNHEMRFVQLVMGPAGVGKSTYCKVMQEHCKTSGRSMHIGNLDPAAENFEYDPVFDIKQVGFGFNNNNNNNMSI